MPFTLFQDAFSRSPTLGAQWRETGFVPLELNGATARLPANATAYQYPGSSGYSAAAARAIAKAVNPKTFQDLTAFTSAATTAVPIRLQFSVRVRLPAVLPGAGRELWAGVVLLAPDQPNQFGWEFQYWISSAGTHYLRVGTRFVNGSFTEHLPGRRNLTAAGKALAAGQEATLTAEFIANNMFVFDVLTWWSGAGASSSAAIDELHLWTGQAFPVVPVAPTPPASRTGVGVDSLELYGGIIAYQDGPTTSPPASGPFGVNPNPAPTPPLLTSVLALDDFKIVDARPFSGQRLFPIPVIATPATLASATVPTEGNASGLSLLVPPSYSVQISDAWRVRELRHDDGTVETFVRDSRSRRSWAFTWVGLRKADRDALRSLLVSAQGIVRDFTWTHPETSEVIQLRCTDAPRFEQIGGEAWNASATVQEVV